MQQVYMKQKELNKMKMGKMKIAKILPLVFLITLVMGIGFVYAQTDYERGTVFLSDVGGGNITFAENITATLFSNLVGNQARFTQLNMLANGTWLNMGFRNDNNNNTLNVTNVGVQYIVFDAIIENNTVIEVYSPDIGEPDFVTGGVADNWIDPTLFITMNADDTVILEWAPNPNAGAIQGSLNAFISLLPLIVLLAFFGMKQVGLISNLAFVWLIAAAIFVAIMFIAVQTGWL